MTIQEAIIDVCAKRDLNAEEMIAVMRLIMTGEATDAQIGAVLMGLRMKGETIDEIVGAASVMRELSQKVDVLKDFLVDTCGTGGDGANIFNVSTASAFVVADASRLCRRWQSWQHRFPPRQRHARTRQTRASTSSTTS